MTAIEEALLENAIVEIATIDENTTEFNGFDALLQIQQPANSRPWRKRLLSALKDHLAAFASKPQLIVKAASIGLVLGRSDEEITILQADQCQIRAQKRKNYIVDTHIGSSCVFECEDTTASLTVTGDNEAKIVCGSHEGEVTSTSNFMCCGKVWSLGSLIGIDEFSTCYKNDMLVSFTGEFASNTSDVEILLETVVHYAQTSANTIAKCGDLNGDGRIDIIDATTVAKQLEI